jgi:DnaJ-class molecular chaperone
MATSDEPSVRRRDRPIGICPRCHAVVRAFDQLGKKCARLTASGSKCPGLIRSAVGLDEWTECPDCGATGRTDDNICARCNGEGWLYDTRRLIVEGTA